jgi:heme/copper-type cytochrome/quinol oxidase subunit 1
MIFVDSFLILAAFPCLNAALAMIVLDRQFHAHFFNTASGGSALLWQHLFWLFGHPEVYVAMLPSFGIFSEVFQTFSRKPIFSYAIIASSSVAIALLSFGVWVHHMFAVGLGNTVNGFFGAASMLIAIPTGIKVFSWMGTMYGGSIKFSIPILFAIAFLIQFTFGGLTGVLFAIVPIDWQLTDTYFVVAHFHYMFIGGAVFGLFAGLFYWFPKITGRILDEKLGKWFFWLFTIGFNTTFLIQHVLGLIGLPRRVWTYPDLPGYGIMNFISTMGAFMMGIAALILVVALIKSLRHGVMAGKDPWDGVTLEWYCEPLSGRKNFDKIPLVKSRRPFWDMKHPENPDWKNERT